MTEKELSQELFGQGKAMGAMAAVKEGVKAGIGAYAEGVKAVLDAGYSEGMKHLAAHGAHELAAALFNGNQGGSGFVMYARGSHDDHGVHGKEEQEQQQSRGGMSI